MFRRAETLCEKQRWAEAEPLFEQVLRLLREAAGRSGDPAMRIAEADVWAHLGVLRQSLDRMHEALESYKRAVELNPALHACFANLAALHAHLRDMPTARKYIERALLLDPGNGAYQQIRDSIGPAPAAEAAPPASDEQKDEGGKAV